MESNILTRTVGGSSVQRPIHLGSLIEQRLAEMGMTKAEFGRRIQISRQNVNSLLHKESLDTGLLLRICHALQHNFFNYFADAGDVEGAPDGLVKCGDHGGKLLLASLEAQAAIARLNVLLVGGG